ncbi:hypothetical protein C8T65DRAFT_734221 [Cerioporus squamosus]|nr:hypothetical protein C8T65DRAFT_734221 [Cerioporus squamosus]
MDEKEDAENEVGDAEVKDDAEVKGGAEETKTEEAADDDEATADDEVAAAVNDAESGAAGGAGERINVTLEDTPEETALGGTDDVTTIELSAPPMDDEGELVALSESDSDDTDRLTLVPAGASQLSRLSAQECQMPTPICQETTIRTLRDRTQTNTDKAQTKGWWTTEGKRSDHVS